MAHNCPAEKSEPNLYTLLISIQKITKYKIKYVDLDFEFNQGDIFNALNV